MLDSQDLDFAILISNPRTWLGLFLCAIVFGLLMVIVSQNEAECRAKTCPTGQVGRLLNHECLCVSKPIEKEVK